MTRKERVERALAHKEADRVPYDQASRSSAIEIEAYEALKKQLGMNTPSTCFLRSHAELDRPVMERLGIDAQFIRSIPDECWKREGEDELFIDSWLVPWRKKKGSSYYELDSCPCLNMDPDAILKLEWPPLVTDEIAADLSRRARDWSTTSDYALFSDQIGAGVFERAWYLRGYEQFLMDLMLEKDWTHRYLEKILERQMEGYSRIFDAIGDTILGVLMTDDVATQNSLMMSRDTYREMVFPYQKRLIEFIKSRGSQVIFHSCGAVYPLIPDLIEAGVEILHPIQRSATGMSPARIKKEFGKDLVLWGGGCDTALLQTMTPGEVRDSVLSDLDVLARDGGLVYSTTHCIQPGTPPANILAMADALHTWGGAASPEGNAHE